MCCLGVNLARWISLAFNRASRLSSKARGDWIMIEKRFSYIKLEHMFGFSIDLARLNYYEYRWWEFELHITLGAYYLTWEIKKREEEINHGV
jgi:hypothetical protein